MVVGLNEAELLPACLSSLWFCDEIFYTDLGSSDTSIEVASSFTDKILIRKKVPSCEFIQSEIVHFTKNQWVIFIDPDEVIDKSLGYEITCNFSSWQADNEIGAIEVPWQFYFKKYMLKGTVWGGINRKILLVNKNRFEFKPIIHYGRTILPNYKIFQVAFDGKFNVLHHFWANSLSSFISKHNRYLKKEGLDAYERGRRYSAIEIIAIPFLAFNESFFLKKGYRDLMIGLLLSFFWTYYKTRVVFNTFFIQIKYSIIK